MTDDKYASERGNPTGSNCGGYSLLFDAYYLKLHLGSRVVQAWHARSGKKVGGVFDYRPPRQKVKGEGPIPEGEYWIQPKQLTSVYFGTDGWGNYRITIHPRPLTVTHGRGGFFIHGGKVFGSAGCIDLSYGMDSFAQKLRSVAPSSGTWPFDTENECYIPLKVSYGVLTLGDP